MANADPHWVQTWIIIGCTGVILTAGYMLWLLKRLFYGPILPKWAGHLSNMNGREMLVAGILSVFIFALGMYPMMVTNYYTPIADRMAADTVKRMAPPVSALPGSVVH
jgi:NADH-quinone oxidoreductase subunit M